jgi:transposase-like protein
MEGDKPPVFILVERGGREDYVPSSDVEAETALKVIGRRISEDSTIYTDWFRAYLGLGEAGYDHEAVNHSAVSGLRESATSTVARTGLPYSGLGWQSTRHMQRQPKPLHSRLQGVQALQRDEPRGSHQGNPEDRSYFHGSAKKPPQPRSNHSKRLATTFLFMSL